MDELAALNKQLRASASRFTAGRYLHALAMGGRAYAETRVDWLDRAQIVKALSIEPLTTGDFGGGALVPIANAFLEALRPFSVALQLAPYMRATPLLTRVFASTAGIQASQIAEGAGIPVLRGTWETTTLLPRKIAAIAVATGELLKSASPTAALAIVNDLAAALGQAENEAFIGPDAADSVLHDAPSFAGSGSALSNIDADLKRLVDLVAGSFRAGCAFVMTKESATFLSLIRGSGGYLAYPNIGPQGGSLMQLPVLISSACERLGSPQTRIVGLLDPSRIFWGDNGEVVLSLSERGALQMTDDATSAAGHTVSLWQTAAIATKAVRRCGWLAGPNAGAFFVAGY